MKAMMLRVVLLSFVPAKIRLYLSLLPPRHLLLLFSNPQPCNIEQ
jgi:hypothetical protein